MMNRKLFALLLVAATRHYETAAEILLSDSEHKIAAGPVNGPATETDALRIELEQLRKESAKLKAENVILRQGSASADDQPDDETTTIEDLDINESDAKANISNTINVSNTYDAVAYDVEKQHEVIEVERNNTNEYEKMDATNYEEDELDVSEGEYKNETGVVESGDSEKDQQSKAPWAEEPEKGSQSESESGDYIVEAQFNRSSTGTPKRWSEKVSSSMKSDDDSVAKVAANKPKKYQRRKKERTVPRKKPDIRPTPSSRTASKPIIEDVNPANESRRSKKETTNPRGKFNNRSAPSPRNPKIPDVTSSPNKKGRGSRGGDRTSYLDTFLVLGAAFLFGLFVRKGLGQSAAGSQNQISPTAYVYSNDDFDSMYCKMA